MAEPVTVVKRRPDAPEGFFEAEAAGLAWLDAAGLRTPRVIRFEPGLIELERIEETRPTDAAAHRFGEQLSRAHAAGADAFGSRPANWRGPLFIGSRSMPATVSASWGEFYARARVEPFIDIAVAAGNLADPDVVRRACDLIASGRFDDEEPPARIHGDLWNGNVLWSPDGVVVIDPAAHGGHRETDLAMLDLFGVPYLDAIIAGYESMWPLRDGWRERIPLHQLHPLAVHAAGHGPHYGVALVDAAQRVLVLGKRRE
jgi:fructosamine-3-kinase